LLEREQQRIELLLYTMMSARQLLSICCQSYSPPPAHFWYDCHQLFSFALARAGRTSIWKTTIHPPPFTGSCYWG
jgi:hypothetical protein